MNKFTASESSLPLARRVIVRIEEEGITPLPYARFFLHNLGVWALSALTLALGSFAAAGLLFEFTSLNVTGEEAAQRTWIRAVLEALPLTWLILFVFFAGAGCYMVRFTKRGYRYPTYSVVGWSIALCVALGTVLFFFGAGKMVDRGMGEYAPFLKN